MCTRELMEYGKSTQKKKLRGLLHLFLLNKKKVFGQLRYDLNDGKQMNDFGLAVQLWKTIPYPTQKKAPAKTTAATTTTSTSDKKVEALKSYKKNSSEFNAYNYYSRYTDLQSAIGPNGDALLKHWKNEFGKKEGRIGK